MRKDKENDQVFKLVPARKRAQKEKKHMKMDLLKTYKT
jgi:hypothetical protein